MWLVSTVDKKIINADQIISVRVQTTTGNPPEYKILASDVRGHAHLMWVGDSEDEAMEVMIEMLQVETESPDEPD